MIRRLGIEKESAERISIKIHWYSNDHMSLEWAMKQISSALETVIDQVPPEELESFQDQCEDTLNQINTQLQRLSPKRTDKPSSYLNNSLDDLEDTQPDNDWTALSPLLRPVAPEKWMEESVSLGQAIASELIGIIKRAGSHSKRTHTLRQLHLAEAHLLLMRMMGIQLIDPRDDKTGVPQFINDVVVNQMLPNPPSEYFVRQPVRVFRNAQSNGKVIENIKAPDPYDRAKILDYYQLIPNGGEEYALREMRNIGIDSRGPFIRAAERIEPIFREDLDRLRSISHEVLIAIGEIDQPMI